MKLNATIPLANDVKLIEIDIAARGRKHLDFNLFRLLLLLLSNSQLLRVEISDGFSS